jgi:hypothetical protein
VCLDKGRKYEVRITVGPYQTGNPQMTATLNIDSVGCYRLIVCSTHTVNLVATDISTGHI